METMTVIYYLIAGGVGAFVADIMKDNHLELPKIINGQLFLGCVGGMIIGAVAGLIVDGSIITAFMGGFAGKEIIKNLINSTEKK